MLRKTAHINRRVVQNIYRAFDYAKAGGAPLNLYAVINFWNTPELSAATAFVRVRHKFRDWLAWHSKKVGARLSPQYVYSFECDSHVHVNWIVRVRPSLIGEFETKLTAWVGKVQGQVRPFDINISKVDVESGYKSLANYITKGCDPDFIDHFHLYELYAKHGSQGAIWGKRAGVSPALNKTARVAAGYDDKGRRFKVSPPPIAPARKSKAAA